MTTPNAPIQLPDNITLLRFADAPATSAELTQLVPEDDKPGFAALLEQITAESARRYMVDLSGIPFCNTSRLGVLLRIHQTLRRNGRLLRVVVTHSELAEVFRLTRIDTIIAVFRNMDSAIEDAKRGP